MKRKKSIFSLINPSFLGYVSAQRFWQSYMKKEATLPGTALCRKREYTMGTTRVHRTRKYRSVASELWLLENRFHEQVTQVAKTWNFSDFQGLRKKKLWNFEIWYYTRRQYLVCTCKWPSIAFQILPGQKLWPLTFSIFHLFYDILDIAHQMRLWQSYMKKEATLPGTVLCGKREYQIGTTHVHRTRKYRSVASELWLPQYRSSAS